MAIALPPGPKKIPLVGNLPHFGRNPLAFISECPQQYGPIVHLQLESTRGTFLISDPTAIHDVLRNTNRTYSKGYYRDPILNLLLGNGLVTSEGEFWMRQRRLSQPAFHPRQLETYAQAMFDLTDDTVRRWSEKPQQTIDIHVEMMRLTMRIVAKTLFDFDTETEHNRTAVSDSMDTILKEYYAQMGNIWYYLLSLLKWSQLSTPSGRRITQAVNRLDQVIYQMIETRRLHGQNRKDLLTALLQARDAEDGSGMTDPQLRDELMTLFLAGHETTANTLSWAFDLLSRHAAVKQKLFAELERVLHGKPVRLHHLSQFTYTDHVLKEVLRLRPPVWWISREANEDVEILGYTLPKGSEIAMSQWVMHHDPRYFPDPESFVPERWENDREKQLPKTVYFPFGGGPRICIGNHFALMEAKVILATILQRFDIKTVPDHTVKLEPSITLRPQSGVRLEVTVRR